MDYVTVRIWEDTRRMLRLIAAQTGEQMVQVMDRLCRDECQKTGLNVAASEATIRNSADPPQPNAEPER